MEQLLPNNTLEFLTVSTKNVNDLVSLVEQLVINKVQIERIKQELSNNDQVKILEQELRIISEIQEAIKKARLIKVKTIHNLLLECVSECAKEHNVFCDLVFNDHETEVESSLMSYISNTIIFFIKDIYQNEFTNLKDASNEISVSVSSDGKNIKTVIESNGTGFDDKNICKKLNKQDLDLLAFEEEEMIEFFNLINTSNDIGELLKLRSDLLYLDGSLQFESEINAYKRITMVIPLAASIMQGLLVRVAHQVYAIPLEFVETIMNKNATEIKKSGGTDLIIYREHVVKLIKVSELLETPTSEDSSSILIVSANGNRVALLVDEILEQTDMVIKNSPLVIKDIPEIKGTTILGDGLVTLVLNIPSILKQI